MAAKGGKAMMALKMEACRVTVARVKVTTRPTMLETKISCTKMQTQETGSRRGMTTTIAHDTRIPANMKASMSAVERYLATAENTKAMVSATATVLEISNMANMASTLDMAKTTETTGVMGVASPIMYVLVPPRSACMSVAIKIG